MSENEKVGCLLSTSWVCPNPRDTIGRRQKTTNVGRTTTMVSPSATTVLANVGGMCMAGGAVYYAINVAKIFGGA